jgi:hypothetical protein
MNILHLVVTRHWFNAITKGGKKIEYRNITPYWLNRLVHKECDNYSVIQASAKCWNDTQILEITPKKLWQYVIFHCGYTNIMAAYEFEKITIEKPVKEWFYAENEKSLNDCFFNIHLGNSITLRELDEKLDYAYFEAAANSFIE